MEPHASSPARSIPNVSASPLTTFPLAQAPPTPVSVSYTSLGGVTLVPSNALPTLTMNKAASPGVAMATTLASSPSGIKSSPASSSAASVTTVLPTPPPANPSLVTRPAPMASSSSSTDSKILDKRRLQDLVKEVDPLEQMDDEVEEVLLHIADDFIDNVVTSACQLAKHRHSNTVEVKDVQLHLEKNWNMWIPGFGCEDLRPYKKAATTEAHKQRLALIKKTLKKY